MYGPRNIPEAAFWLAAFVAIGWLAALAIPG
jgi:hypothetical protein